MAVTTTKTNKPINPRGNDASPLGYNRAALYSGKALDFDGVNDYVDCGTLDVTAYTAISMSFNFQLANITDNGLRLVSLLHSGVDDIRIEQGLSVLRITLDDGTAYTLETPSLTANEWNKFDMTFNGTTLEGYINGVSIGSISASFNFSTANGLLNLYKHTAASSYAEGSMSGFKLFNTALTPAQVSDLYNNPEKIVPTGVEDTALKLWLPMMEGAGTTAYDGSGNGNHGTISGATYVNGVGSPVAQSAVIDWNKTTNLLPYSEEFNQWTQFGTGGSITANNTTAPDGLTTADKFTFPAAARTGYLVSASVTASVQYRFGIWLKADSATTCRIFVDQGCANFLGAVVANVTTEWQLFSVDVTPVSTANAYFGIDATTDTITACGSLNVASAFYAWGAFAHLVTQGDAYVKTGATAQTSPVLLPQGLTSGRDITGVNLFENVRKQGALNLDGNSWAEVHDNASLDITSAITLECWIYFDSSGNKGLLSKWNGAPNQNYLLYKYTGGVQFYISSTGSNSSYISGAISTDGWHHVVGTDDGTTQKIYIDSVLKNNTPSLGSIFSNSSVVEIGRYNLDNNTQYPNNIAQPRIYNRALTAEEVQRNYNASKGIYQ